MHHRTSSLLAASRGGESEESQEIPKTFCCKAGKRGSVTLWVDKTAEQNQLPSAAQGPQNEGRITNSWYMLPQVDCRTHYSKIAKPSPLIPITGPFRNQRPGLGLGFGLDGQQDGGMTTLHARRQMTTVHPTVRALT